MVLPHNTAIGGFTFTLIFIHFHIWFLECVEVWIRDWTTNIYTTMVGMYSNILISLLSFIQCSSGLASVTVTTFVRYARNLCMQISETMKIFFNHSLISRSLASVFIISIQAQLTLNKLQQEKSIATKYTWSKI